MLCFFVVAPNTKNMNNFTINRLPLAGMSVGQIFEDEKGKIFRRIQGNEAPLKGNYLMHIGLSGGRIQTTISVVDGQVVPNPIFVPNSVFSDGQGNYFIRTLEEDEGINSAKALAAGCGYIVNRQYSSGEIQAFSRHPKLPRFDKCIMPKVLFNEFGVPYNLVDFRLYGLVCKALFGYVEAEKVEPVYLLTDVVGTKVNSVLGGVNEHAAVLKDGEVLVQNAYHGECYKQKREKLLKNYEPDGEINGIPVYRPKKVVQQWTMTEENIFGPLWGSFEFLAKAMINITDERDVYGCNFAVFAGDDTAIGSHKKLRRFLPANPLPKEEALAILAKCRDDERVAMGLLVNSITQKFVEVPLGVCEI